MIGYRNSMVAWSVMDSIIKFLNKEIADAAIFGTKHCFESEGMGWMCRSGMMGYRIL